MGLYYHLSGEEKEFAKKKSLFCLIIYDIISNKRRLRLAKLLEGFGMRVQRSCFEIDLEKASYQVLIRELEYFYDPSEFDNIIVYTIISFQICYILCLILNPTTKYGV